MGVNEKMTAVADEIRLKTGLPDAIGLDQIALDIASIATDAGEVPDYVREEAERVAAVVEALQNDGTVSFIAITDSHIGTSAQSIESVTHAAQGASIISGRVPIDFVTVLGDTVTGAAGDDMETHLGNLTRSLRALAYAAPALRLVGNHDANPYNKASFMEASEVYRRMGRFTTVATKPSEETDRGYFYYDLTEKKMRVICLNSADMKDADINALVEYQADGHHISAAQFNWLVSALDMTDKNGWNIIVLSHHPLHWYGSMPKVLTILDAYVAGTGGSVTADGATVSYDFSGKNAARLIGTFHGHTHNFIHGTAGNADIPRIGTPNACPGGNNSYGSSSYSEDFRAKYGETETYGKTAASAKDTAFCVYTIDTEAEVIHATCYGAGYDRTISYGGSKWYTVTNNLSSVSTDNAAASIEGGASYTANLSVAANYSIESVTVTMGGVDVTASVYADGVINIAEVTGDIVITATASGFTNLIDSIGYEQNVRISTSSGENRDATGYVTTGYIDLSGLPDAERLYIRTRGVDFRASNNANCCVATYYGDKTWNSWSTYLNEQSGTDIQISFDDDGNMTFSFNKTTSRMYVRLTGYGSGDNLIVTLNEEITEVPEEPTSYTNLILLSVDADGSAYNGGKGYKDGYRINSSGVETVNSGTSITGFIPVTRGDVVRFSGFAWLPGTTQASNHKVVFYSPDKACVWGATLNNWPDSLKESLSAQYDSAGNLIEFTLAFNSLFDASSSNVGFMRLVADTFDGDEVVTINEEIA